MKRKLSTVLLILVLTLPLIVRAQDNTSFTFAGFAVSRELYTDLIEQFKSKWQAETGESVIVLESYQASGALSRAIAGGFEVHVGAFQHDPEVDRLVDAGVVTHDWREVLGGYSGTSVVVFAVREGNPKNITDWADLARDDVEIVTPNPSTSGGARWMYLAAYGAALRGEVEGYEATPEGATAFLSEVIRNTSVLARDGRESFITFEDGIGDLTITYENEIHAALNAGSAIEPVYPTSTILLQQPIVIVDEYVDEAGNREVVEAFVEFVRSDEGQRIFIEHGYRPVNETILAEIEEDEDLLLRYPPIEDLFTVEVFENWAEANLLFGEDGEFTQLIAEIKGN